MKPGLIQVDATVTHHELCSFLFGSKGEPEHLWKTTGGLLVLVELDLREDFELAFESFGIFTEIELLQYCFATVVLNR